MTKKVLYHFQVENGSDPMSHELEFKSDGNSDNNGGGGASRKVSTASRVSHHTRIYTDTPSNNTNTEAETVSLF